MKGKKKEQLYLKQDYDDYHFSLKEFLKYLGQALALCVMADYVFYNIIWVAVCYTRLTVARKGVG